MKFKVYPFTCQKCEEDFSVEYEIGNDVICPHCCTLMETNWCEENGYGFTAWTENIIAETSPIEMLKDELFLLNKFDEYMREQICCAFMIPKEYLNE